MPWQAWLIARHEASFEVRVLPNSWTLVKVAAKEASHESLAAKPILNLEPRQKL